ncbi:GNAT family N-acetyltransferase [Pseudomonas sp. GOM6]|uniref:GNAT family N-acetyltransferase n=1 Tax=Pseudomonas sp. GOM6 TaxID=3036944 RepID=UPI0024092D25|nr:GNAT family N-acetyltransferase [Pseudomonas sp. GOM6]MDG1579815.1 GNAT family N-acetyltransferase [Pseudomonas sp. GOM6]
MSINRAAVADLDALVPLFCGYLTFYQREHDEAEVLRFLAQRLERGESVVYLARDGQGRAQGFVQLYPFFASLQLSPAWLLSDLFVAPAARRQGLAEALMDSARVHAEATGACGLQLETAKDNFAGQALYEKLGYVRDEVFYTYWLAL